jgi:hypothetical protein
VLILLLLPCATNFLLWGQNLTGWAWIGAYFVSAVAYGACGFNQGAMPIQFWLPWTAMVVAYMFGPYDYSVQNAAQILCPPFVGYAASTMRPPADLFAFVQLLRKGAMAFLAILVFLRVPILLVGVLPKYSSLAPEAIASVLFQAFFLCSFILWRQRKDLILYFACAAVPVIALTRGPIIATFLLAGLCLVPLPKQRRLLIIAFAVPLGLTVFYSERFQVTMFRSSQGTIADIFQNPKNIRWSGRDVFRDRMMEEIPQFLWTGHGGNATSEMMKKLRTQVTQPHNDWLRIIYNYGLVGLSLYVGAVLLQVWHLWRTARYAPGHIRLLFYCSASAFIPYAFIMYTDNILIYAQYFGNLHFLMIGLAYGSLREFWESGASSRATANNAWRAATRRNMQPLTLPQSSAYESGTRVKQ